MKSVEILKIYDLRLPSSREWLVSGFVAAEVWGVVASRMDAYTYAQPFQNRCKLVIKDSESFYKP